MDPNSLNYAKLLLCEVDFAKLLPSVINCGSAIIVSAVAIYGINSWRREYKGKRKMELAEEVLSLFYQARDAFASIRSPLGYSSEGQTRESQEDETPEQKAARNHAYVVYERYEHWKETFSRLQSLKYRFMAVFGKKTVEPFDVIRKSLNRIFLSAQYLADLWPIDVSGEDPERQKKHFEEVRKQERYFWEGEDDEIQKNVQKAVEQIEAICEKASKS